MKSSLAKIAQQKKIKYFLISFVDLFGIQRAKLVPARAISEMQKTGAGFGGFATTMQRRKARTRCGVTGEFGVAQLVDAGHQLLPNPECR